MESVERFWKKISSPAGNRTPVSRVTGGDTYHYTTEDTVSWTNLTGCILKDSGGKIGEEICITLSQYNQGY